MPIYNVSDPISGKSVKLTGDSPPTEQELIEIFDSMKGAETPTAQPTATATPQPEAPEWAGKYPNLYGAVGAAKEVSRFAGETAGLVGGAIVGAPFGPAGSLAGAALGYGGVKALERGLEGEKATLPEAAKTTGKDVMTGAAMEMGGRFAGKLVGGLIERMSIPAISGVPKVKVAEILENARKLGIELSPAEATGSKGQALYESMLDKSPFSAGIVTEWRELRQLKPFVELREKLISEGKNPEQIEVLGQKIKDQVNSFLGKYKSLGEQEVNLLRDNILKKMGSSETYESIGKTAQEVIAERSKAMYQQANALYDRVGELVPEGAKVNIGSMKDTAKMILESEMKKPSAWRNTQLIKRLEGIGGPTTLEQEITAYPEAMQAQIREQIAAEGSGKFDWKTVQSMRSDLGKWIADADASFRTTQPGAKFQSSPEAGAYKQLRKALEKDIDVFAVESGEDVKGAFDVANAFYREGKMIFNTQAIKRVLTSNPEKVVDMIFRPGGGTEVDLAIKAMGRDAFDRTVKPALTKKLLDTGDVFDTKKFGTNLDKYGKELLAKVYNPTEVKALNELLTDGKMAMQDKLMGAPFLKTISNERPEVVVDSILGAYDRSLGGKTVLKNALLIRHSVDKPTFESLQRELSDRIFKLNQITHRVQPERLAKTIQNYDRVLDVFYSPEQVSWLRAVAETGRRMASAERLAANPSGTAQNIVTWGTWGALLANPIKGTFTGIIAPKAMAKIYLSDAGRRYFTLGMKTPMGSKQGVEIATKLSEIAGLNIQDQQVKEASNE